MKALTNVTAGCEGDVWLIAGKDRTAVVDTGMEYCSGHLVENIRAALNGRALDYVLLTHSHYDHVSGVPALRRAWPDLTVVAHPHAAKILAKESAIRFIREMTENAYTLYDPEHTARTYPVADYRVDQTVGDGDTVSLGDLTVRVIETPGHTKCCISFYIEEMKLLFPAETVGFPSVDPKDPITVKPSYLTSYVSTAASIQKLMALDVRAMIPAHSPYCNDASVQTFLDRALAFAKLSKDFILGMYTNGFDEESILKVYCAVYSRQAKSQPSRAFLVNARASVACVIREYETGALTF